ncbi:MAG TPA: hypothetical protein VNX21_08935 [Candidatus Thermoplasmatota archaeon]|nr:hypothetical protein [Candidatus Thermoplasmatota archaeon]
MKTIVLVMAICAAGLILPGAAEAHLEACVGGGYFSTPSSSHMHWDGCEDPEVPDELAQLIEVHYLA